MSRRFDLFVILAHMRTGSNLLESNLQALEGVRCHGEAFNPYFIGAPDAENLLGITQAKRDADPARLLARIRDHDGRLGGFRFFPDHDPRILGRILDDPRCAKIILTRNPLDSYVSLKIAQTTGQWKLTDVRRRRDAKVRFDADEFRRHEAAMREFSARVGHRLQVTGQAAFRIAYDDLRSVEVLNGLAEYLGVAGRVKRLAADLKAQNPQAMAEKVTNPEEMRRALAASDRYDLDAAPEFEPRRSAAVPAYVTAARAPLVYLPIRCGPEEQVLSWLAALDNTEISALGTGLSQRSLRQWKRRHPRHRGFTVLCHPARRAHAAFCRHILGVGGPRYSAIARLLRRQYGVGIPEDSDDAGYNLDAHRAAFVGFLEFAAANLNGQTAVRVDPAWCSQYAAVQGFADFALPDVLIRESTLETDLPRLADSVGLASVPPPGPAVKDMPFAFEDVYDDAIESAAQRAYRRDYMMFGFERWR
ncbi:nodulation protein NodH [Sulfitobacter sp. D35]|uniref:nodulation protein NodH n=1 Tax=Sulfitobacter sp. D35 TaxID=3083252 RepID=UPI00296FECA8|nr:nodulation protein NodH [Sulfitobacter sp. D35]MDW4498003.1 nodulation protein NodH [Sulfitobacter sp. D35]